MKLFVKWIALALLGLLLVACGGAGEPTPLPDGTLPTAEAEVEPSATPEEARSQCSVTYMPVAEGASWNYLGSGETGPFSWSVVTSAVTDTSFTVTQTHDSDGAPLIVTQHWVCSEEGVTALEYGSGADASLTYTGLNATLETLQTTGITLPRNIQPGDSWQQTFQIQGTVTTAELVSEVSGNVTQSYQAISLESVSGPAGSFEALKVEVVTSFDLQMSVMGISVPFSLVSNNTTWLAPNVGWVKSTGSATVDGSTGLETMIDLQSYNIP